MNCNGADRSEINAYTDNTSRGCHIHETGDMSDTPSLMVALPQLEKDVWEATIDEAWQSLVEAGKWLLSERPCGNKGFTFNIIFKKNRGSEGNIDRFKARIELLEHLQMPDLEYGETYAHLSKFNDVRALLAKMASSKGLVHQMDVKCAFLNGALEKEMFMSLPREYAHTQGLV